MLNVDKIAQAVGPLGATGVAPLHETGGPAMIFATDGGKVYRIDFDKPVDDETCTRVAKAIEDITGEKVESCHATRTAAQRDKAIAEAEAASKAAAAEAAKAEAPPVKAQSAAEAEHERLTAPHRE